MTGREHCSCCADSKGKLCAREGCNRILVGRTSFSSCCFCGNIAIFVVVENVIVSSIRTVPIMSVRAASILENGFDARLKKTFPAKNIAGLFQVLLHRHQRRKLAAVANERAETYEKKNNASISLELQKLLLEKYAHTKLLPEIRMNKDVNGGAGVLDAQIKTKGEQHSKQIHLKLKSLNFRLIRFGVRGSCRFGE